MPLQQQGRVRGSIFPPHHLRAGLPLPARVVLRRFFFLLALLSPTSFSSFLGYLYSLLFRELFRAGLPSLTPTEFS
jgi:hypothetical protein